MGMFDHLPSAAPAAGGGMFDHLPALRPEKADPLYAQELRKAKASFDAPRVPAPEGVGAPATPEQAAAEGVAHQRGQEAEQTAFDATRTPMKRVADTATFAASLPVRMATKGEYGIGDVAELVGERPEFSSKLRQNEGDFATANQPGLETAAAAGDVMAGIPFLNTMGAVPGQVMRTGAAAARDAPRMVNKLLRDDRGAGLIPGAPRKGAGGTPPGAPPPPPAGSPPATPPQNRLLQAARLPNREETFAASERLGQDLGAKVDIPEMVVGGNVKQSLAAGLRSIPFAGEPIEAAYTRGLGQLDTATKAAGKTLGDAPGREAAGEGLKQGALTWIGKNSKEHLESLYEPVYTKIDPAATRPLSAAGNLASNFAREMKESTGTAELPALKMIEAAVGRKGGLTVRGQARLRTEIGEKLDESIINKSPDQRALKRAYGALTEDLRASIRQHGGDEALKAWDTANREARIVASKSKRLARAVGTNEDKLSSEKVFDRALAMGQEKGGDARGIALLKEVVGEKQWGDFGSQIVDHMGKDLKTGLFSGDRFLSELGKLSQSAKQQYFGAAAPHLEDIATIAKKFGQLSTKFNRSNTGIVNAVLKILSNPAGLAVNIGTAAINPMSALTIGTQVGSLAAGRRVAWTLARPSSAQKAAKVLRAYYGVARAAGHGAEAVAKREEALSQSIRAFSMEAARQTSAKAADIEAELTKAVKGQAMGKPTQADLLKSSAWSESHAALKTSLAEDFPKGAARFKGNPEALRAFKGLQEKVSSIVKGGDKGEFSSADDLLSAALRDADALDKAAPGATSKLYTQYVRLAARKRGLKK